MARSQSWTSRESGELLEELDRLRRFTRALRHGFWIPLVLLGLLMIGATPLYFSPNTQPLLAGRSLVLKARNGASRTGSVPLCHAVHGVISTPCTPVRASAHYFPSGITTTSPRAIAIYWLITLPLAYAVVVVWAHRRALRRGVATSMLGYAVVGVGLVVALVVAGSLSEIWTGAGRVTSTGSRGLAPLFVIALGLLVLALRERSSAMWAFAIGFLSYSTFVNLYDLDNLTDRLGLSFGPEISVFLAGALTFLVGVVFALREQPAP